MGDINTFAQQFIQAYYNGFDNGKNVASFYQQPSTITFQDKTAQGAAIAQLLPTLPTVKHNIPDLQIKAQQVPVPGVTTVFIKVIGQLIVEGQTNPLNFSEAFILAQNGQNWFILNDIMQLATI